MSAVLLGAAWLLFVLSCFVHLAWENGNDETA